MEKNEDVPALERRTGARMAERITNVFIVQFVERKGMGWFGANVRRFKECWRAWKDDGE